MSELRIDTSLDHAEHLNILLAKQAEIEAQIRQVTSLIPSPSNHRTPIHKQHQQRRSYNVPRSMSTSGTMNMARTLSDVPIQRPRTLSQQSAPSMARANSRGASSQRTGNLPFTLNGPMPPPLHTEPRRENTATMAWAVQEPPFSSQTLSHQPPQLQRSMSQLQRKSELEQVVESQSDLEDLEDPGEFIFRKYGTPTVSISPSATFPSPNTLSTYQLPSGAFHIPTPSTPTSDSLTTATTITSNMSRQNSLNEQHMLESMQLMKCSSSTSYSPDISHDQSFYDQVPHFTSSHHSRRSSNEEQSQLLVGAGGASHESQFSHSLQFPSSGFSGEKMEKSESNESTSSSSSAASRNKQRLQAQINLANARPIMPKGGSEDSIMSRENSSQSMSGLESRDGSSDKVAISSKPTYTRPKHDRVYCKQCDSHQEGFRGEHELRRHQDREHKPLVKKFVCIEPTDGQNHPKPILPLTRCKACHQQKKKYGAYYNAAAHLRRAHFKPKSKSARTKSNTKVDDGEKRGGKGGGDWPPMSELKYWMKEVEEQVTDCPLTEEELAQEAREAAEASDDDDNLDASFDDMLYSQQMTSTASGNSNFDNFADASPMQIYPQAVNIDTNMYGMQNMPLDLTGASQQSHCMDQSMYTPSSQNSSFPNFSPQTIYQNDTMSFFDASSSNLLPQNFDDQVLLTGHDFVEPAFY